MSKRRRNKGMPHTPGAPPVARGFGHGHRARAADPSPAPPVVGECAPIAAPRSATESPCKEKGRGGGQRHAHPPEQTAAPAGPGKGEARPGVTRRQPPAREARLRPRFWETVPLAEMTPPEWEALCDGCGKCCLLKLEDADTGRVHYTNVACRLYDCESRSCARYALRRMFVPGCVVLSPENIEDAAGWMPASCAYRRLHEGRGLADWHPLVSGDPASVERAGQALTWPTIPEYDVAEEDLEDHVLDRDLAEDDGETP